MLNNFFVRGEYKAVMQLNKYLAYQNPKYENP